jgi:hypothetical protein
MLVKTPKSFRDKFHELTFYAFLYAGMGKRSKRYGFTRHCGKRECQRRRFQIRVGSLRAENGLAV